ncbi:MAG: hypothetical protein ACRDRT_02130 [Pseudonocardiaceae bacterium]
MMYGLGMPMLKKARLMGQRFLTSTLGGVTLLSSAGVALSALMPTAETSGGRLGMNILYVLLGFAGATVLTMVACLTVLKLRSRQLGLLARWATEASNVKVCCARASDMPLAEAVGSLFSRAGWGNVSVANVPLDSYIGRHFPGVEVRGYDHQLVEDIARVLRSEGVPDVWTETRPCEILAQNPKYRSVIQSVRVTIGHLDQRQGT